MTCLAHVSDTHFGTEDLPVCSALRKSLIDAVPRLVVVSGDVTQRARAGQFRAARDFLDSLGVPVIVLPGNHDLPVFNLVERFAAPYRGFRRHLGAQLAPCWEGDDVAVIGVNSTRLLRHKHGALTPAIVYDVAGRIARLRTAFKIVALHHPLDVVEESDRRNRVRGADEALAEWTAAGADLFLGGHIHLPYCIAAGPEASRAVVLQAGTAVSTRRRGGRPNSYHLVRLEKSGGRRMHVEQHDYDAGRARFAVRRTWRAEFGAGGWTVHAD